MNGDSDSSAAITAVVTLMILISAHGVDPNLKLQIRDKGCSVLKLLCEPCHTLGKEEVRGVFGEDSQVVSNTKHL